jgi:Oxidoreductase family, NAD-binding Rossmann fold
MTPSSDRSPSSPTPLRIAVVGAGAIGRKHIALIKGSAECTLSAIVDPSPAVLDLAAGAGVPWFRTLAELLTQDRPDGVVIATPNPLHVDNALACIEAGVVALVEKPIAHTVDEAERLCRAVDATGARVLIGHHRAHSPCRGPILVHTLCKLDRCGRTPRPAGAAARTFLCRDPGRGGAAGERARRAAEPARRRSHFTSRAPARRRRDRGDMSAAAMLARDSGAPAHETETLP